MCSSDLADGLNRLNLQAGSDEALGHIATGLVRRDGHEFAQPRHRGAHQASSPKAREKRMSPSTMSCMSVTPLRNISVRSMPMPKAKPE